ncbi:MAG: alpha/beta fold hydrolase [Candidatus Binatus sp.]|uniref:esterase/lipase family protein n=1 Tax=Candidatus Binatus sp. TaxID=2811406 RepID=UPI00271C9CFB|nr:alpha/beta fold hydrolase [Candidatus Binatus sp.]MDO8432245.1 alpha/beta fold hydrolase [Candidatus Binatus sp.]
MAQAYAMTDNPEEAEPQRPSLLDSLGELRFPFEASLFWLGALSYPWPRVERANSKTVMLIPGFMAGDVTLAPMANFCRWLGHRAVFAGIWSNSQCPRESVEHLSSRLARTADRWDSPIVVIGHSLGGIYARELAHRNPQLVERVITLGSPIRWPRDSSNHAVAAVARSMARIRGKAERCLSEACSCGLRMSETSPKDVPTTVVYSRTDGVVHWQSCVDNSDAPTIENVEVLGSHVGMAFSADVYRVIAARLALPLRPRLRLAVSNPDPGH